MAGDFAVGLAELVKNLLNPVFCNADACVADIESDEAALAVVITGEIDCHAAVLGEFDRIADNVDHDLADASVIATQERGHGCEAVELDKYILLYGFGAQD